MSAKNGRLSALGILAEIVERPVEAIPADASIFNFPAWDSVAHVRLMMALEDVTGKPVDPGRIAMLADLQSIDMYLDQS